MLREKKKKQFKKYRMPAEFDDGVPFFASQSVNLLQELLIQNIPIKGTARFKSRIFSRLWV